MTLARWMLIALIAPPCGESTACCVSEYARELVCERVSMCEYVSGWVCVSMWAGEYAWDYVSWWVCVRVCEWVSMRESMWASEYASGWVCVRVCEWVSMWVCEQATSSPWGALHLKCPVKEFEMHVLVSEQRGCRWVFLKRRAGVRPRNETPVTTWYERHT